MKTKRTIKITRKKVKTEGKKLYETEQWCDNFLSGLLICLPLSSGRLRKRVGLQHRRPRLESGLSSKEGGDDDDNNNNN
jgi:hypothetical protein